MNKFLLIFFFSALSAKEAFSEIKEIICVKENSVNYVDGVMVGMEKVYDSFKITKETGTTKWCFSNDWRELGSSGCSYLSKQDTLSFNWYIPFVNFDFSHLEPNNEEKKLKQKENYELWLKRKWKESYVIDIKNKKFRYESSRVNIYPKFYKGHVWSWVTNGNCEIK